MFFFFTDGATTPLARAVSAELRSEMAVQRVTGRALAGAAQYASHNYVAERLRDEKPFTLDDVERLARALEVDPGELIERAWRNHGERLEREAEKRIPWSDETVEAALAQMPSEQAAAIRRDRARRRKDVDEILREVDVELAQAAPDQLAAHDSAGTIEEEQEAPDTP